MKLTYSETMYKCYNSLLVIVKNSSKCFSCKIYKEKLLLSQNGDTEVLFSKEGVLRFPKSTWGVIDVCILTTCIGTILNSKKLLAWLHLAMFVDELIMLGSIQCDWGPADNGNCCKREHGDNYGSP